MTKYEQIIDKLKSFIHKYYVNELLKGLILFFAIGLFYFLLTVFLEYFFWLGTTGRLILFWFFIIVELTLFGRFIIYPCLKLFNISKGISYEYAAEIIGKFFPEINDKLLNVLQLNKRVESGENSDLLLAGIDQKAKDLQPVPFNFAINFKNNLKYLKYALIPLLIIFAIWISGKSDLFSKSYSRVVNYKTVYEPPAPFSFVILNKDLNARENKPFTLHLKTQGELIPDNAKIHFEGESYLLENKNPGEFSYQFDHPNQDITFYFEANGVKSRSYKLDVINVPSIQGFEMQLNYPTYLHKKPETIRGTGNATIPEGTHINWQLKTKHTKSVVLSFPDTTENFAKKKTNFSIDKTVRNNTYYKIKTSNKRVQDYEELSYQFKVIKDQYPEIQVDMKRDTTNGESLYFHGQASDDYGLTQLQLVYYPIDQQQNVVKRRISISQSNFDEFVYVFPDTLHLERGKSYELYFQVFDNDGVNNSKSAKSELFSYRKLTDSEVMDNQLNEQSKSIEGMTKSLQEMNKSSENLEDLNRMQKEKENLDYNDKKKLQQFYERQKQENDLMKNYSEKLKKNLDNYKDDKQDDFKDQLKDKLERQEKRLEENEKLLEELQKYQDKISKEELSKKLEELAKQKKNQNISLEKLLELTKRYYVEQKAQKISQDLNELAKKQRELSEKDSDNTSQKQKELSDEFDQLKDDYDDLEKENNDLKDPMDLKRKPNLEKSIDKDQKDAEDSLEKAEENDSDSNEDAQDADSDESQEEEKDENAEQNSGAQEMKQDAQQKQKSAADKMEQMSEGMQSMMQMAQMEQMSEDIEMLRQILDNLIVFSFQQEDVMEVFDDMSKDSPEFRRQLKHQYTLKENFQHVDDSLFALTLRNPFISDEITSKLVDINFNLDKSLERLQKNNFRNGVTHQRRVMTGANDLANMLDNAMDNMQMMMQSASSGQGQGMSQPGKGSGQGQGFQLPDIIQGQEDLNKSMEEGQEKKGGQKGDQGEQEKGQEGDQGEGQEGDQGEEGSSGKNGKQGSNGQFSDEMDDAQLYEIYKQQQKLRMQLEDLIQKEKLGEDAKRLSREMEYVEQKLLRDGATENTGDMMKQIKEHLMRLQNASYKQRQSNQRESETNTKDFNGASKSKYEEAKKYFNTTDILNRQSLPLQPSYKELIQEYFRKDHD